jgi:type IV secretion system protein VirD4
MKPNQLIRRLQQSLHTQPKTASPIVPSGGIYLGWGTNGPVMAGPEEHTLILGPPRSGKTSRLIVPGLLQHRGPAVVTSTKADVVASTIGARTQLGTCWYWDPSGTTPLPPGARQARWSPVTGCGNWDEAVARAHALATAARPDRSSHEAYWIERAQALLAPLLHAAALSGSDLAVVLSWLHRRVLDQPLSILVNRKARRASDLLVGFRHTDNRELSGIISTADSLLAAYRTDAALRAAREPNFDPAAFAASADTLYLVSPGSTQHIHAAIVIALLDQIRTATYRRRPRPPMLFALDEVANIAPIPNLPSILAEGGSQGLVIAACLQDLSQARARWGAAADGFLTLFTNKVLLPGIADTTTLKAVSILAGEIDVPVPTVGYSTGRNRGQSSSWTSRRQPRLPADQVANLPGGTALLVRGTGIAQLRY